MAKPAELPIMQMPGGQRQQITPYDLVNRPLAEYYEYMGRVVNAQSYEYYDTAVIVAGTAVTSAMKQALFTKGKDQDTVTFNTAAAIPEKGEFLTNMITDGEFEGGTTFILERIGVHCLLPSDAATTYGARGQITAPAYAASVTVSSALTWKSIMEQMEIQYRRNEDVKIRKPLIGWGSPWGAEGAFGAPNAGFIQNGRGSTILSRPVVLESEDRFSFLLQSLVETFTPNLSVNIKVVLGGQRIQTFTP